MNRGLIGVIVIMLSACQDQRPNGTEYGPPQAALEIKQAFSISEDWPSIQKIRTVAQERRYAVNDLGKDKSLIHCQQKADKPNLSLQMFIVPRRPDSDFVRNYVVLYDDSGRVLCIETRHAHRDF